jgi:hypothetical protein
MTVRPELPPPDQPPPPGDPFTLGQELITAGCGCLFLSASCLFGMAAVAVSGESLSALTYVALTLVAWSMARSVWKSHEKETSK